MDEKEAQKRRLLLHNYEQQLQTARRLARYKVRMRLAEGLAPDDPDPEASRRKFSSKISQELYDSLLFYPSTNPVVEEIRKELSEVLGKNIEFTYPPGGTLKLAIRENNELRSLTPEEQNEARLLLRRITTDKVDKSVGRHLAGVNTIL